MDAGAGEGGWMAERDGLVDDGDVDGDRGWLECGEGELDGADTAIDGQRGLGEGGMAYLAQCRLERKMVVSMLPSHRTWTL